MYFHHLPSVGTRQLHRRLRKSLERLMHSLNELMCLITLHGTDVVHLFDLIFCHMSSQSVKLLLSFWPCRLPSQTILLAALQLCLPRYQPWKQNTWWLLIKVSRILVHQRVPMSIWFFLFELLFALPFDLVCFSFHYRHWTAWDQVCLFYSASTTWRDFEVEIYKGQHDLKNNMIVWKKLKLADESQLDHLPLETKSEIKAKKIKATKGPRISNYKLQLPSFLSWQDTTCSCQQTPCQRELSKKKQVASLNCCTPPADATGVEEAGAGVGSGFGAGVGAESPVSTSIRTEPTLTVSCTCSMPTWHNWHHICSKWSQKKHQDNPRF